MSEKLRAEYNYFHAGFTALLSGTFLSSLGAAMRPLISMMVLMNSVGEKRYGGD